MPPPLHDSFQCWVGLRGATEKRPVHCIDGAEEGSMEEVPSVLRTIERGDMDRVVDTVHRPVQGLMVRYPGLRAALDGSWLGHPLHAALVSFPIGAWATVLVLDAAGGAKNKKLARAADTALGFGLILGLPTAVAGLAEWSHLEPGKRRQVAFVHASANVVATSLFASSFFLRKAGMRRTGVALSMLGLGIVGFSAWLGGQLTYRYRAGVDRFSRTEPRELEQAVPFAAEQADVPISEPRPMAKTG
jgi:uncharacterized membrane protein